MFFLQPGELSDSPITIDLRRTRHLLDQHLQPLLEWLTSALQERSIVSLSETANKFARLKQPRPNRIRRFPLSRTLLRELFAQKRTDQPRITHS